MAQRIWTQDPQSSRTDLHRNAEEFVRLLNGRPREFASSVTRCYRPAARIRKSHDGMSLPYPLLHLGDDSKAQTVMAGSSEATMGGSVSRIGSELRRGEYFAGLFILGCASGFASRIIQSVDAFGWKDALFGTFGISVIIWVSCVAGISLVFRDRTVGVQPLELGFGAVFAVLVLLPNGPLSWIAVTGLSLYIAASTNAFDSHRGAIILLATTVPLLWSCMLFQFFANLILGFDAFLVSWLLGTHRTGNLVDFADHSGQLVIFPPCSSLANVSLAFLCWVTLSQLVCHRKSIYDFFWCILACAAVVAVNVARMTFLGLSEWHYATFHNEWGDAVVGTIIAGLIVGISALGVRRELFQRI